MSKLYKCGLYLGRFQPFHVGHQIITNRMLRECEKAIIAVGSAQESGTRRNPLSYECRERLIKKTFHDCDDRLIVIPICDRVSYSDDSSWGDYLFEQIEYQTCLRPEVVYEGDESTNDHWYDNFDIKVNKIPRYMLPVIGTEVRQAIIEERNDYAINRLPRAIYDYYDEIRKEIQNAKIN